MSVVRTSSRRVLVVLGLLAVAGAGVVCAEEAGADESGLLLQVEYWSATPRNADLDYATVDASDFAGGGTVRTLKHESAADPLIYVGWRPSSVAGAEFGVRFWQYDESSDSTTGVDPLNIGPILTPPDFLLQVVDSATAETRLRASTVDVGARFGRDVGERLRLEAEAGIRMFRYEETTSVAYRLDFGQVIDELIRLETDSRGIGPRIAGSFVQRFGGGRVGLGGSLGIAFPIGDLESRTLDDFVIDGSLQSTTLVSRPGTRKTFFQLDGQIRVDVRLTTGWTLTLGYVVEHWSGVRKMDRFVDEVAQNTIVGFDEDVVFEGGVAGLRYQF